jgi:hypothetical protein
LCGFQEGHQRREFGLDILAVGEIVVTTDKGLEDNVPAHSRRTFRPRP